MFKKYLSPLENNQFSLGQTQPIRCNLTNRKLLQSHSPPTSCRACIFLPHETHQMSHDFSPDADRQRIQMIAYHRPELLRHSVTNEKGSAYDFEKSKTFLAQAGWRTSGLWVLVYFISQAAPLTTRLLRPLGLCSFVRAAVW